MRFFRRIAGLLGLARDDGHEVKDEEDDHHNDNRPIFQDTGFSRRGFGVPVQVTVDRPHLGPVLLPCTTGDGGVQVFLFVFFFLFTNFKMWVIGILDILL